MITYNICGIVRNMQLKTKDLLLKKIVLFFISILIVFLFLEVFLRAFHVDDSGFERIKLRNNLFLITQESKEFGTVYKPNVDTFLDYTGRERQSIIIKFKTLPIPGNEIYGMRDDGVGENKKIVVLGDSYTWGATLNESDVWLESIERKNNIDMVNLAQGSGISKAFQEYKTLEDGLPDHEVVIYAVGLINEFLDNYAFAKAMNKVFFSENSIKKTRWFYPIITKSKVAYLGYKFYSVVNIPIKNFYRKLTNSFGAQTDYLPEVDGYVDEKYGALDITLPRNQIVLNYALLNNTNPIYLGGLEETKKSMEEFSTLIKSKNRKLVIVLIPFKEQVYYDLIKDKIKFPVDIRQPNNFILENCKLFDIICIDATNYFVENNDMNLYWYYDVHLTPVGQNVLANFVEKGLKSQNLLS